MDAAADRPKVSGTTFRREITGPFLWLRVVASATITCLRCDARLDVDTPAFVNWMDRAGSEAQRHAADGFSCSACGALIPTPLPLLQYRRGDVVGLVVAFPSNAPTDVDRAFVEDVIAIAGVDETEGASAVAAVRMHWWGTVWKRPLGPALVGAMPIVLPETSEEADRWRADMAHALTLPNARSALESFVTCNTYDDARSFLRQNDYLISERWRLTVDTLGREIERNQTDPEAARLVAQRLGRLRQVRLVGVERADEATLTGPVAQIADRAANETDPRKRAQCLRELLNLLDKSGPDAVTAAALTTLVASLHAHPDRGIDVEIELLAAAERALEAARSVFGDDHPITSSAIINLAVVTEERTDIPRRDALARATELLHDLAPRAARTGGREVADIATNLAAIKRALTADEAEEVTTLLDDATHIRSLVEPGERRSTIVELVDRAAALRSRQTGSRRANALDAIAAIERARQLEAEWSVLSPAESVLLDSNEANALHQLHEFGADAETTQRLLDAARTACASANARVDRLHPVAIDALANAGGILSDLYSESLLSDKPDRSLWAEAIVHLEDAYSRARELYSEHHEVTLRIMVNLASAYGRPIDGTPADSARCEELFEQVIERAPADRPRFTVVAAMNLGQLRLGQCRWRDAADAYGIAATAHDREVQRARTRLTKIAEIANVRELAARRALALSKAGMWPEAIAALENARGRLSPTASDHDGEVEPSEGRAVATVHVACSAYGTLGAVRVPDGTLFGFHSALSSRHIEPLIERLLVAPDRAERHGAFDALGKLLTGEIVDPIATIATHSIAPVEELQIVACGALAACPLHAIEDLSGRTLISRFVVRYRRTTHLAPPVFANAQERVVAVIAPSRTLPFARAEREVVGRWAASLTEPPDGWSQRSWLLHVLPAATAVHMACHARSNRDDPMESAFDVGDQAVTVRDLAEVMTPQLALVVAPACQAATPSPHAPDELLGVAHALVHSGARAVIASLWDADDEITAFVISVLYREMVAGRPPVDALATAQRCVATITGPELRDLARQRLAGENSASWLPHELAVELSALSAHPDLRAPESRCFPHPADWATLSYLER